MNPDSYIILRVRDVSI